MRVNIAERIKQTPELASALDNTTQLLEEELGPSSGGVAAEWTFNDDDPDRPVFVLTISDYTGKVTTKFAPYDLRNPAQMQIRLHRLWGDLLQVRSNKQVEKLKKLVHELEVE